MIIQTFFEVFRKTKGRQRYGSIYFNRTKLITDDIPHLSTNSEQLREQARIRLSGLDPLTDQNGFFLIVMFTKRPKKLKLECPYQD